MTTKKLKPTETPARMSTDYARDADTTKLDRLKAAACDVANAFEDSGCVDSLRTALLDGHAVEEELERFYTDKNDDVWKRKENKPDSLVGGARTCVSAENIAANLNDLNHQTQRPVSPFGRNTSGFLTFRGEPVVRDDIHRAYVGDEVPPILNALWDGNGEHDE